MKDHPARPASGYGSRVVRVPPLPIALTPPTLLAGSVDRHSTPPLHLHSPMQRAPHDIKLSVKDFVRRWAPARWWPWLQIARLAMERRTFPRRWVRHTYEGHPLRVLLGDVVGAMWYDHDWTLPELPVLLTGRLKSGSTVFNIGAHQGVVAMVLAQTVGSSGRVVAVEADRFHATLAEANRAANGIEQLVVRHAAVGEVAGPLRHDATTGAIQLGTGPGNSVPAVTIDELTAAYGAPDVIYMDVEGYEALALRGATATLAAGTVDVLVEVHGPWLQRYGTAIGDLLQSFPAATYRSLIFEEGSTRPLPTDLAALARTRFVLVNFGRR